MHGKRSVLFGRNRELSPAVISRIHGPDMTSLMPAVTGIKANEKSRPMVGFYLVTDADFIDEYSSAHRIPE